MSAGRAALLVAAGLALGFILLPLVLVSWLSFFRDEVVVFPPSGYTLRWFRAILDQRNFVDGFVTSLEVGVFAMLAGLALGVPASLCLTRYRFPGREGLGLLLLTPLVVPGVVAGTAGRYDPRVHPRDERIRHADPSGRPTLPDDGAGRLWPVCRPQQLAVRSGTRVHPDDCDAVA